MKIGDSPEAKANVNRYIWFGLCGIFKIWISIRCQWLKFKRFHMKVQISDFFWNKIDDLWNQGPKLNSLAANPLKQDVCFLIHHRSNTSYFFQTLCTSFICFLVGPFKHLCYQPCCIKSDIRFLTFNSVLHTFLQEKLVIKYQM